MHDIGLISTECCTFKPLNSYMLIPQLFYLFNFVLFQCFQVIRNDTRNTIDFRQKKHFRSILAKLRLSLHQKSLSTPATMLKRTCARLPKMTEAQFHLGQGFQSPTSTRRPTYGFPRVSRVFKVLLLLINRSLTIEERQTPSLGQNSEITFWRLKELKGRR